MTEQLTEGLEEDDLEESSHRRPPARPPGKGPAKPIGRHFRPRVRERKPAPPENYYPDVYAFVGDFLAPLWAHEVHRQLTTFRWCPWWYLHTQAVARLEALWKAWEVLRLDPGTGSSVWFRDHADPCMSVLTGSEGIFRHCMPDKHHPVNPLP